jgi:hypothetical protein
MGKRNGAYRTGRYTAEAKAERGASRVLLRELKTGMRTGGLLPLAGIVSAALPTDSGHRNTLSLSGGGIRLMSWCFQHRKRGAPLLEICQDVYWVGIC